MDKKQILLSLTAMTMLGVWGGASVANADPHDINALDALVVARDTTVTRVLDNRIRDFVQDSVKVQAGGAAKNKDLWVKVDKNWGNIGSLDMHGTTMTVGYDKQFDKYSHGGVLFTASDNSYAGQDKNDKIKDYRLGLYELYHRDYKIRSFDAKLYIDYGMQKHDASRGIYASNYNSRIIEGGLDWKHDYHAHDGKIYHVSVYSNHHAAHYMQDEYDEGDVKYSDQNSNYIVTEKGVEIARFLKDGNYAMRLGYSHIWRGKGTTIYFHDSLGGPEKSADSYTDRYFITASFEGQRKLNDHGWGIEGGVRLIQGAHDKAYGASAMLTWKW